LFPQANALSQRAQAAQLLLRLLAAKVASNQPFGPDLVDQLAPHALAYAGSLLTTLAAAAAETPQDEPLSPSVLATKAVRSWFT
jgi:hypothetical protein